MTLILRTVKCSRILGIWIHFDVVSGTSVGKKLQLPPALPPPPQIFQQITLTHVMDRPLAVTLYYRVTVCPYDKNLNIFEGSWKWAASHLALLQIQTKFSHMQLRMCSWIGHHLKTARKVTVKQGRYRNGSICTRCLQHAHQPSSSGLRNHFQISSLKVFKRSVFTLAFNVRAAKNMNCDDMQNAGANACLFRINHSTEGRTGFLKHRVYFTSTSWKISIICGLERGLSNYIWANLFSNWIFCSLAS